jgi:pimeloyl-ACP methyl ester carboxylesterase
MRSQTVTISVTGLADVSEPLEVAATVHLPDSMTAPKVVAVGMPGGGYNRHYYDLRLDGLSGYSQAEYHTDRGWVFIACDPAGVGDSSTPSAPHSIEQVGAVQAAAVNALRQRLAGGTLVDGLVPTADTVWLGLGQSMGGCFTIAAQGLAAPYDAIGILGFSALHTQLPLPEGRAVEVPVSADGGGVSADELTSALMESFRWAFHWEDVPADVAAWDMASVPLRTGNDLPPWGLRAAALPCGADMLAPGIVAASAASITVPILSAQGERDVVPDPHAEPAAYGSSNHVTVVRIPTMAHMHNFASTRHQIWRAIHAWGEAVSAA